MKRFDQDDPHREISFYEYTIKINWISLNVKFPCNMVLKFNSQPISPQVAKSSPSQFFFDHEIILKDSLGEGKFEIAVFLITAKKQNSFIVNNHSGSSLGTNTIFAGQIKLQQQQMHSNEGKTIDLGITNCLDSSASCNLTILRVRKLQQQVQRRSSLQKILPNEQSRMSRAQTSSIMHHINERQSSQAQQQASNSIEKIRLRIDSRNKQSQYVANRMSNFRQSAVELPPKRSKEKLNRVDSSTNIKPPLSPMGGFYLEKYHSLGANGSRAMSRQGKFQTQNIMQRERLFEHNPKSFETNQHSFDANVRSYQGNCRLNQGNTRSDSRGLSNQKRIQLALQRSQEASRMELQRMRKKIDELQKTLQVKNTQIREQKEKLFTLQQDQLSTKYWQEELSSKTTQLHSQQTYIKTLRQENDQLKAVNMQHERKIQHLQQSVKLQNQRLKLELGTLMQQSLTEIKSKKNQLDQYDFEFEVKQSQLNRMKRMIEELEENLQQRTFEYEREIAILKQQFKRKLQSLSNIARSLQHKLKVQTSVKLQAQRQVDRLKQLLQLKETQFYTIIQEITLKRDQANLSSLSINQNHINTDISPADMSYLNNNLFHQKHFQLMKENKLLKIQLISLKSTIQQLTKQNQNLVRDLQLAKYPLTDYENQHKQSNDHHLFTFNYHQNDLANRKQILQLKEQNEYLKQKLQSTNNKLSILQNQKGHSKSKTSKLLKIEDLFPKSHGSFIKSSDELEESLYDELNSQNAQLQTQKWKELVKAKNVQIATLDQELQLYKKNQSGKEALHKKTLELKQFMINQLLGKLKVKDWQITQLKQKLQQFGQQNVNYEQSIKHRDLQSQKQPSVYRPKSTSKVNLPSDKSHSKSPPILPMEDKNQHISQIHSVNQRNQEEPIQKNKFQTQIQKLSNLLDSIQMNSRVNGSEIQYYKKQLEDKEHEIHTLKDKLNAKNNQLSVQSINSLSNDQSITYQNKKLKRQLQDLNHQLNQNNIAIRTLEAKLKQKSLTTQKQIQDLQQTVLKLRKQHRLQIQQKQKLLYAKDNEIDKMKQQIKTLKLSNTNLMTQIQTIQSYSKKSLSETQVQSHINNGMVDFWKKRAQNSESEKTLIKKTLHQLENSLHEAKYQNANIIKEFQQNEQELQNTKEQNLGLRKQVDSLKIQNQVLQGQNKNHQRQLYSSKAHSNQQKNRTHRVSFPQQNSYQPNKFSEQQLQSPRFASNSQFENKGQTHFNKKNQTFAQLSINISKPLQHEENSLKSEEQEFLLESYKLQNEELEKENQQLYTKINRIETEFDSKITDVQNHYQQQFKLMNDKLIHSQQFPSTIKEQIQINIKPQEIQPKTTSFNPKSSSISSSNQKIELQRIKTEQTLAKSQTDKAKQQLQRSAKQIQQTTRWLQREKGLNQHIRQNLLNKIKELNDTKNYLSQLLRSMERPLSISNDKNQRLLIKQIQEKVFNKKLNKKSSERINLKQDESDSIKSQNVILQSRQGSQQSQKSRSNKQSQVLSVQPINQSQLSNIPADQIIQQKGKEETIMVVSPSEIRENHLLKDEIKELCEEIAKLNGQLGIKDQLIDEYEFRLERQDDEIMAKGNLVTEMQKKLQLLQVKIKQVEEEKTDRVGSEILTKIRSPSESRRQNTSMEKSEQSVNSQKPSESSLVYLPKILYASEGNQQRMNESKSLTAKFQLKIKNLEQELMKKDDIIHRIEEILKAQQKQLKQKDQQINQFQKIVGGLTMDQPRMKKSQEQTQRSRPKYNQLCRQQVDFTHQSLPGLSKDNKANKFDTSQPSANPSKLIQDYEEKLFFLQNNYNQTKGYASQLEQQLDAKTQSITQLKLTINQLQTQISKIQNPLKHSQNSKLSLKQLYSTEQQPQHKKNIRQLQEQNQKQSQGQDLDSLRRENNFLEQKTHQLQKQLNYNLETISQLRLKETKLKQQLTNTKRQLLLTKQQLIIKSTPSHQSQRDNHHNLQTTNNDHTIELNPNMPKRQSKDLNEDENVEDISKSQLQEGINKSIHNQPQQQIVLAKSLLEDRTKELINLHTQHLQQALNQKLEDIQTLTKDNGKLQQKITELNRLLQQQKQKNQKLLKQNPSPRVVNQSMKPPKTQVAFSDNQIKYKKKKTNQPILQQLLILQKENNSLQNNLISANQEVQQLKQSNKQFTQINETTKKQKAQLLLKLQQLLKQELEFCQHLIQVSLNTQSHETQSAELQSSGSSSLIERSLIDLEHLPNRRLLEGVDNVLLRLQAKRLKTLKSLREAFHNCNNNNKPNQQPQKPLTQSHAVNPSIPISPSLPPLPHSINSQPQQPLITTKTYSQLEAKYQSLYEQFRKTQLRSKKLIQQLKNKQRQIPNTQVLKCSQLAKMRNDYYELLEANMNLQQQLSEVKGMLFSAQRGVDDHAQRLEQLQKGNAELMRDTEKKDLRINELRAKLMFLLKRQHQSPIKMDQTKQQQKSSSVQQQQQQNIVYPQHKDQSEPSPTNIVNASNLQKPINTLNSEATTQNHQNANTSNHPKQTQTSKDYQPHIIDDEAFFKQLQDSQLNQLQQIFKHNHQLSIQLKSVSQKLQVKNKQINELQSAYQYDLELLENKISQLMNELTHIKLEKERQALGRETQLKTLRKIIDKLKANQQQLNPHIKLNNQLLPIPKINEQTTHINLTNQPTISFEQHDQKLLYLQAQNEALKQLSQSQSNNNLQLQNKLRNKDIQYQMLQDKLINLVQSIQAKFHQKKPHQGIKPEIKINHQLNNQQEKLNNSADHFKEIQLNEPMNMSTQNPRLNPIKTKVSTQKLSENGLSEISHKGMVIINEKQFKDLQSILENVMDNQDNPQKSEPSKRLRFISNSSKRSKDQQRNERIKLKQSKDKEVSDDQRLNDSNKDNQISKQQKIDYNQQFQQQPIDQKKSTQYLPAKPIHKRVSSTFNRLTQQQHIASLIQDLKRSNMKLEQEKEIVLSLVKQNDELKDKIAELQRDLNVQKKLSDYNLKKRLRKGSEISNQILINIDQEGNQIADAGIHKSQKDTKKQDQASSNHNNMLNFAINQADQKFQKSRSRQNDKSHSNIPSENKQHSLDQQKDNQMRQSQDKNYRRLKNSVQQRAIRQDNQFKQRPLQRSVSLSKMNQSLSRDERSQSVRDSTHRIYKEENEKYHKMIEQANNKIRQSEMRMLEIEDQLQESKFTINKQQLQNKSLRQQANRWKNNFLETFNQIKGQQEQTVNDDLNRSKTDQQPLKIDNPIRQQSIRQVKQLQHNLSKNEFSHQEHQHQIHLTNQSNKNSIKLYEPPQNNSQSNQKTNQTQQFYIKFIQAQLQTAKKLNQHFKDLNHQLTQRLTQLINKNNNLKDQLIQSALNNQTKDKNIRQLVKKVQQIFMQKQAANPKPNPSSIQFQNAIIHPQKIDILISPEFKNSPLIDISSYQDAPSQNIHLQGNYQPHKSNPPKDDKVEDQRILQIKNALKEIYAFSEPEIIKQEHQCYNTDKAVKGNGRKYLDKEKSTREEIVEKIKEFEINLAQQFNQSNQFSGQLQKIPDESEQQYSIKQRKIIVINQQDPKEYLLASFVTNGNQPSSLNNHQENQFLNDKDEKHRQSMLSDSESLMQQNKKLKKHIQQLQSTIRDHEGNLNKLKSNLDLDFPQWHEINKQRQEKQTNQPMLLMQQGEINVLKQYLEKQKIHQDHNLVDILQMKSYTLKEQHFLEQNQNPDYSVENAHNKGQIDLNKIDSVKNCEGESKTISKINDVPPALQLNQSQKEQITYFREQLLKLEQKNVILVKQMEDKRKEHLKGMTIMGEKNNELYNTLNRQRKAFAEQKANFQSVIKQLEDKLTKVKDYLKQKKNPQYQQSVTLSKNQQKSEQIDEISQKHHGHSSPSIEADQIIKIINYQDQILNQGNIHQASNNSSREEPQIIQGQQVEEISKNSVYSALRGQVISEGKSIELEPGDQQNIRQKNINDLIEQNQSLKLQVSLLQTQIYDTLSKLNHLQSESELFRFQLIQSNHNQSQPPNQPKQNPYQIQLSSQLQHPNQVDYLVQKLKNQQRQRLQLIGNYKKLQLQNERVRLAIVGGLKALFGQNHKDSQILRPSKLSKSDEINFQAFPQKFHRSLSQTPEKQQLATKHQPNEYQSSISNQKLRQDNPHPVTGASGSYIEPLSQLDSLVFSETHYRHDRPQQSINYNVTLIKGWIIGLFKDDDKVKLLNQLGLAEFVKNQNENEISDLKRDYAKISEMIEDLKKRNQSLIEEKDLTSEKICSLMGENQRLKKENDSLSRERQLLVSELKYMNASKLNPDVKMSQMKKAPPQDRTLSFIQEISGLRKEISQLYKDKDNQINELRNQINQLSKTKDKLKQQLLGIIELKERMNQQLNKAVEQMQELQSQNNTMKKQLSHLAAEQSDITSVKQVSLSISKLQFNQVVTGLQPSNNYAQKDYPLGENKASNQQLQLQIEKLTAELSGSRQENSQLVAQINRLKDQIHENMAVHNQLKQQNKRIKSQLTLKTDQQNHLNNNNNHQHNPITNGNQTPKPNQHPQPKHHHLKQTSKQQISHSKPHTVQLSPKPLSPKQEQLILTESTPFQVWSIKITQLKHQLSEQHKKTSNLKKLVLADMKTKDQLKQFNSDLIKEKQQVSKRQAQLSIKLIKLQQQSVEQTHKFNSLFNQYKMRQEIIENLRRDLHSLNQAVNTNGANVSNYPSGEINLRTSTYQEKLKLKESQLIQKDIELINLENKYNIIINQLNQQLSFLNREIQQLRISSIQEKQSLRQKTNQLQLELITLKNQSLRQKHLNLEQNPFKCSQQLQAQNQQLNQQLNQKQQQIFKLTAKLYEMEASQNNGHSFSVKNDDKIFQIQAVWKKKCDKLLGEIDILKSHFQITEDDYKKEISELNQKIILLEKSKQLPIQHPITLKTSKSSSNINSSKTIMNPQLKTTIQTQKNIHETKPLNSQIKATSPKTTNNLFGSKFSQSISPQTLQLKPNKPYQTHKRINESKSSVNNFSNSGSSPNFIPKEQIKKQKFVSPRAVGTIGTVKKIDTIPANTKIIKRATITSPIQAKPI